MKIELKNIKYSATFSEETNCFKADVYVDGISDRFKKHYF